MECKEASLHHLWSLQKWLIGNIVECKVLIGDGTVSIVLGLIGNIVECKVEENVDDIVNDPD